MKLVEVAVGVVIRPDGAALFGERVAGKPYAGWWEFPGGKLESGETVEQALARELHEELGLVVHDSSPWVVRDFVYPHASVRLHFQRVTDWSGEPASREGQRFEWQFPHTISVGPLLPAALPVIEWLRLPRLINLAEFTGRVLSLVELRAAELPWQSRPASHPGETVTEVITSNNAANAADSPQFTATGRIVADQWPSAAWVETAEDIERAERLGCGLVLLGDLGRSEIEALARVTRLPLFADAARDPQHASRLMQTTGNIRPDYTWPRTGHAPLRGVHGYFISA